MDVNSKVPVSAIRFLRCSSVLTVMGLSKSELYRRINAGLFIPPIAYGTRMKVWPCSEVNAIADAYLTGKSEDEIRCLVKRFTEERKHG